MATLGNQGADGKFSLQNILLTLFAGISTMLLSNLQGSQFEIVTLLMPIWVACFIMLMVVYIGKFAAKYIDKMQTTKKV